MYQKGFLIHKEEKVENRFEKKGNKREKILPINENEYMDCKASVK
jgi:hypothetical protein